MPTTYFVALPFVDSEEGPAPSAAIECQSAGEAKRRAEALVGKDGVIGAIAFQRTGEPDTGEFTDAVVLGRYGDAPSDLSGF